MDQRRISARTAKALFAQTQQEGATGKVQNDLAAIAHSLCLKEKPWELLQNPLVNQETKKEAIAAAFNARVQPVTLRLLQALASREQLHLLGAIAQQLGVLADNAAGIARAQVRSTYELTQTEQARLEATLGTFMGKKVVLETRQDSGLIAGLTIKIGDHLFEHSLRRQLRRLEETLTA